MANSFTDYVGDGSTTLYNVPFSYIDRSHVDVLVDGVPVSFSWITGSTVDVTPAPANGANVRISRTTPKDPVVDFQDGENLTEQDLDNVNRQSLFLAQETEDNLTGSVSLAENGQYDAENRRIENVAAPVNPKDAVNKTYADAMKDAAVSAVQAAQATAEGAIAADMAAAAASADDADASAQASALSAAAAAASEAAAASSEADAEAAKIAAEAAEASAQSYAASINPSTLVTKTGVETVSNKTLSGDMALDVQTFTTGATGTLDPANGLLQVVTLGQALTLSDAMSDGEAVTLMIDDGTDYTITWPVMTWVSNDGVAPVLQATAKTVVTIWKVGTSLFGYASNGA